MPKITVNVTQDRIERGEPLSSVTCPIALALREEFGLGEFCCEVTEKWISFACAAGVCGFPLPEKAREFVFRFDKSPYERLSALGDPAPPSPFSFELELPFPPPKGVWTE